MKYADEPNEAAHAAPGVLRDVPMAAEAGASLYGVVVAQAPCAASVAATAGNSLGLFAMACWPEERSPRTPSCDRVSPAPVAFLAR
eukprot:1987207-Pleurochrysis_carterae.AAC.1